MIKKALFKTKKLIIFWFKRFIFSIIFLFILIPVSIKFSDKTEAITIFFVIFVLIFLILAIWEFIKNIRMIFSFTDISDSLGRSPLINYFRRMRWLLIVICILEFFGLPFSWIFKFFFIITYKKVGKAFKIK